MYQLQLRIYACNLQPTHLRVLDCVNLGLLGHPRHSNVLEYHSAINGMHFFDVGLYNSCKGRGHSPCSLAPCLTTPPDQTQEDYKDDQK